MSILISGSAESDSAARSARQPSSHGPPGARQANSSWQWAGGPPVSRLHSSRAAAVFALLTFPAWTTTTPYGSRSRTSSAGEGGTCSGAGTGVGIPKSEQIAD